MNIPVKFPIAELLKEKGIIFNTKEICFLHKNGEEITDEWIFNKFKGNIPGSIFGAKSIYATSNIPAPTIAEVVMWLYEKHGIWIVVNPHKGKNNLGEFFMEFDPDVWSFTDECEFHNTGLLYFNSPTEAYEAAIEYTLNNLI